MIDTILDLIYPPVCGICGKLDNNSLCKKCEIKLKKQAIFGIDNYKEDKEKHFDEHAYIFMYDGLIRSMIINYKFDDKSYLYKTFVKFLLKNEKIMEFIKSYGIIIPVPLSKNRKKQRGYNQSGLIAKEISRTLEIELNNKCLRKVQDVAKQSSLNRKERLMNINGAYEIKNPEYLYQKKVLIIDDVYTTGSTANECSREISKAGTKKIGVLTIAKD